MYTYNVYIYTHIYIYREREESLYACLFLKVLVCKIQLSMKSYVDSIPGKFQGGGAKQKLTLFTRNFGMRQPGWGRSRVGGEQKKTKTSKTVYMPFNMPNLKNI